METQMDSAGSPQAKSGAKDFFINLGAIVALYTLVFNLVDLLFTVINKAYPQIINGYNYSGSTSISFSVATLIIFFPIFIVLMWLLEKDYSTSPEKQNSGIHKWLTYITLFISGLMIAGDLITVLYYFLDGQELTTGFLLKVLVLLVIVAGIFSYYLLDTLGKLSHTARNIYRIVSFVIIIGSIIWGFSVLGSPRTQQLLKYDEQKVSDLQNINNQVVNFYESKSYIPGSLSELSSANSYSMIPVDEQTQKPYEYVLLGQSAKAYQLCATFNQASNNQNTLNNNSYPYQSGSDTSWSHSAGHYCFTEAISVNLYTNPTTHPIPAPVQ